ncbi:MAG: DNA polymerase I, partial [Pirellulales bacterium]|nr:DNA polymerase I [Pirellulales bacterium]
MPPTARAQNLPGFDDSEEVTAHATPVGRRVEPIETQVADETEILPGETSDLADKNVWVVDAHSLIFQVFHAIAEMTSPRGQPVNAVFGFTRDLLFILEEKKPDLLFCAFDLPGGTFRNERFPEYKADRGEMPEDLVPQIDEIRR